jgi:hypothetical protein
MRSLRSNSFAASAVFLCSGAIAPLKAGRPLPDGPPPPKPVYGPLYGTITLELGFTADELNGRANLLVPLYRAPNGKNMFFLDGNWSGRSDSNENGSAGFGFRHRLDDPDIIIGFNAFYDYGDYSGRGYDQLGIGFELLSKWFDFRANGYFPDQSIQPFGRFSTTRTSSKSNTSSHTSTTTQTVTIDGGEGGDIESQRTTTTTTTNTRHSKKRVRKTFERYEGAMPGFDLEVGGLIPYLDCWAETRAYVGYAFFDDPFGHDISCFTARLESRPVPALIFNIEYKGDTRLVDGDNHWFFCARVEIPFDLGNLIHGQSPFAGITEAFTPQGACWGSAGPTGDGKDDKKVMAPPDVLRNRMNEEIIRNWRPTVSRSDYEKVSERTTTRQDAHSTTRVTRTETN